MDGCYGFSSLGHKLTVCGTKKRHYILEMVLSSIKRYTETINLIDYILIF